MRYCYSLCGDQLHLIQTLQAPHVGFEIRLDSFTQTPDPSALRALTPAPLLATYRTRPHLGFAELVDREHLGWDLRRACLTAGFDWIDLELDEADLAAKIDLIHSQNKRVVLSHHDLGDGTSLPDALEKALATKADLIKIIGTGQSTQDLLRQRQFYQRAQHRPLIHFAMGADFAATRVFSLVLGAPFTFLTANPSQAVAPGQLTYREAHELFRAHELHPDKLALYAVIGKPIGHSQSPAFHNPRLKDAYPHALFLALPAEHPEDVRLILQTYPELRGMAVTKPMKEPVFAMATGFLHAEAAHLGASNTLLRQNAALLATNTDYLAMKEILAPFPKTTRVRILGYGGLGKAVVAACNDLDLEFELCNRTPGKIPANLPERPWSERHLPGVQVIVQATSVGMSPNIADSPLDVLPPGVTHLIETIYAPLETALCQRAKAANVAIIDGLALFDAQARIQNRLFCQTLPNDLP